MRFSNKIVGFWFIDLDGPVSCGKVKRVGPSLSCMSSCLFGANICIVCFVLVRRRGALCCGAEHSGASRCIAVRFAALRCAPALLPVPFARRATVTMQSGVAAAMYGVSVNPIPKGQLRDLRGAAFAAAWKSVFRTVQEVAFMFFLPWRVPIRWRMR